MTLENLMQKIRASEPEPDGPDDMPEVPDDLSSLEQDTDLLERDGPAARVTVAKEAAATSVRKRRRLGGGPKAAPEKLTAANKRKVKDILVMMITLPGGALAMRDPVCGGALVRQADPIADALVPIIARNPAMLRWFLEGGGWMDYMALLMALQPVGAAVWGHHVTGSQRVMTADGEGEDGGHAYGFTIPDA